MFSFGFFRPLKRSSNADHSKQSERSDSEDGSLVNPPDLSVSDGRIPCGRTENVTRSSSAPSGEFLSRSRRRGIDMILDESAERPKPFRDATVCSSDNGLQLVPDVGKPGSLMDPRSFCDVAEWKETSEYKLIKAHQLSMDMAVLGKVYRRSSLIPSKEVQIICQERILAKLAGVDGVMHYYHTLSDSKHICLIFNQDLRPSLNTFIAIHGGKLREQFVVQKVACPLVVLITDIHRLGIIHRNLAPEHILFSEDVPVVLTDFDNAVDTSPVRSDEDDFQPGLPNVRVGSLEYMAPEVADKPTSQELFHEVVFKGMAEEELPMYGTKADVFSLGIMLYKIMLGKVPWSVSTPSELQALHMTTCIKTLVEQTCTTLSTECRDFLCQCLESDPDKRASGAVLLHHPWISSHVHQARLAFEKHRNSKKSLFTEKVTSKVVRRSLTMNAGRTEATNYVQENSTVVAPHLTAVGSVSSHASHSTKFSKSPICVEVIKHRGFC